ncbi:hypothetical protein CONCODRAFT_108824 [Conidiobolus coronatus NRRL 28638]|uniref:SAC3/GANP/THP3 conserved domain-containing protein n=1 Tax=Conidiobolus coronatus (strain ATCC 28846 / CBS 209.66 / NRRL 28638) TaxID=796925 RepID=A0A137PEW9_CONC2|nr:hypothetical protein CONCODRAFT_108824 [Conidiobolus coronatus NRRL 28638]|eukprot:KXN73554.1 hypothetical protein CONCODRAFT_108824 [Conidiobolus coronatus NRRL 28638]
MGENTFTETHTFIRDRTRQIRKDVSVQHIFSLKAVNIYETIARFHILGLRHCMSIQDNMKLEKEEFSRTLVGLKDQYLELHKKNKLKHELEFFAYYTLNFLETESDVKLPFRCISDQANSNKRDLISFVLKACDLYSTLTNDDSIIQEFNETKKDPLARVKEFFSMFNQNLWDFPIYLVTIICEKIFDSVRYKALKIFQCIQKNCTAKFTSYPLKLFIANLHFGNKDEAEGFLTKYSFKTFVNNGVEKIHVKFNTPLPGKPLETVVIGCESIVQPLRLHCESLTDIDLILGKIDYNIHSAIDLRPVYKEFDPDSIKSEFSAMSPPVLPSGFSSDKFRAKTSAPATAFSNFPNTSADNVSATSGSSTESFKNSSNFFAPAASSVSTGGFQTSANTSSNFPSTPFGMSTSVSHVTGPVNPFGGSLKTQKDSTFNSSFTSASSSQSTSSFIPNFTSSKSEANPFLAGSSFSNSTTSLALGKQPSSNTPLNIFKTTDTQSTFASSLEQKTHEKLPSVASRPITPPVIEQSPPPSPVSFQSFITFNWQSRKKTVDQILSRIPIINPKKHKYLTTPENDPTIACVSSLTQAQVKSILKSNLRNRLILSIKKAIQEYAFQLINIYLPAVASLSPVEKFNTWKNYRETLHRLSSGQLVSAAYATFETGQYSAQIRNRIDFESKCLWTHTPSSELFELLSTIKSVPQNHKHFVTICIPQSSWDLHRWYKERLRLEFDKSGEFLIKKLKIFHNSEIEIRVVPRELPMHLFETKGCKIETSSYSLVYCMGLPSLNWIDSDYWNQESSHLFKFLATIPNKFLSIQTSLLINYTHPTANSVSDFQYKVRLFKFLILQI